MHLLQPQKSLVFNAHFPGTKLVAYAQALLATGSARWSNRFSIGPFPVTMACTKKPNMENMASRPFFSSLTFNSAKASGSSAKPSGSKAPPGYTLSNPSPVGRLRPDIPPQNP
ncbi:hypothetical protein HPP92_024889 [Vanilla planifolia]|uniref:Uncharacterized protein n=1 Tax=Vanilla planifolia TaxID=51239 RepID=A0A835PQ64_VANPL|nr:hypothetical protein HPP92_024889 [Vanilla planifolia]